jgi:hypothetical protein
MPANEYFVLGLRNTSNHRERREVCFVSSSMLNSDGAGSRALFRGYWNANRYATIRRYTEYEGDCWLVGIVVAPV